MNFIQGLTLLVVSLMASPAMSQTEHCGDATISILKIGEWEDARFQVLAKLKNRQTELWLNSVDYVTTQCVLDRASRPKILINAYCGGSGCSESTYTIINPITLMVELVPVLRRSNIAQVEEILGKSIAE